jgi:hypothetical protein
MYPAVALPASFTGLLLPGAVEFEMMAQTCLPFCSILAQYEASESRKKNASPSWLYRFPVEEKVDPFSPQTAAEKS